MIFGSTIDEKYCSHRSDTINCLIEGKSTRTAFLSLKSKDKPACVASCGVPQYLAETAADLLLRNKLIMSSADQVILSHFPDLDTCVFDYIQSVIDNGKDDFETAEDVHEFLGELLLENADGHKTKQEIKSICDQIFQQLIG